MIQKNNGGHMFFIGGHMFSVITFRENYRSALHYNTYKTD